MQLLTMTSETSEHDNSSHVPSIANTTNMFPLKRKNRSEAWNHFIPEVGSSPKAAKCNYCEALIQYNNGTSSMRDPRRKFKFVDWMTTKVHGSDVATSLRAKLESCLKSIYAEYSGEAVSPQGNCTSQAGVFVDVGDPYDCSEFYQSARSSTSEYELNKYFEEDLEDRRPDFDLLAWWKVNSARFPILAKIARDVLAIPISTVASESAFSNGGRILDEYRSSLTPTSVEALVCTQDWLEGARLCSLTSEDFDALERIEEEMFVTQDVSSSSSSIALNDD